MILDESTALHPKRSVMYPPGRRGNTLPLT